MMLPAVQYGLVIKKYSLHVMNWAHYDKQESTPTELSKYESKFNHYCFTQGINLFSTSSLLYDLVATSQ
jgi:hypothetical protein